MSATNAQALQKMLESAPIIAAVKDERGLEKCLAGPAKVVFLLFGSVVELPGLVLRLKNAKKTVMVHVDLVDGLSAREAGVEYIAAQTRADGILSTKAPLVRKAQSLGLIGIRRFFLLDSIALASLENLGASPADFIEVLPGVMPKILAQIASRVQVPLIAGGLIMDKEDVVAALAAGALAVSSTNAAVWAL